MSTETKADLSTIAFPITPAMIAEKCEKYGGLKIGGVDDKNGYKMVKAARIDMKGDRVATENRRKELKAGALQFGREVDRVAKLISEPITAIENELKAEEQRYLDDIERIKQAEIAAKQEALKERMEQLQSVNSNWHPLIVEQWTIEEFETKLVEATDIKRHADEEFAKAKQAEVDQLTKEAAERKAESERLAAEQKKIDEQRRKQAEEQAKLDAERKDIEDEKERIATEQRIQEIREDAAKQAKIDAEYKLEREAAAKVAQAESDRVEAERIQAMKPDIEKLLDLANQIESLAYSVDVSAESADLKRAIDKRIVGCAIMIRTLIQSEIETA